MKPYKGREAQHAEARRLRAEEGLTLAEISERVGVPTRTVFGWTRDVTTDEIVSANKVRVRGPNLAARRPLAEVLVEGSSFSRTWLRQRLVEEGVLANVCATCGLGPEWESAPLTLELHHLNGVGNDNRLENLQLLCPNCHSQTESFGGRNKT